jgi:Family of unknown function (DUF5681)
MAKRSGGGRRGCREYEVGYGKPPTATRFQKGRSGNPRGRAKGSREVGTILNEILDQKVTLRTASGTRQVSYLEAILIRAADSAGKGDLRALKFLLDLKQRSEPVTAESIDAQGHDPDDRAIIADYIARHPIEVEGEP